MSRRPALVRRRCRAGEQRKQLLEVHAARLARCVAPGRGRSARLRAHWLARRDVVPAAAPERAAALAPPTRRVVAPALAHPAHSPGATPGAARPALPRERRVEARVAAARPATRALHDQASESRLMVQVLGPSICGAHLWASARPATPGVRLLAAAAPGAGQPSGGFAIATSFYVCHLRRCACASMMQSDGRRWVGKAADQPGAFEAVRSRLVGSPAQLYRLKHRRAPCPPGALRGVLPDS